jgi:hypothetical protein
MATSKKILVNDGNNGKGGVKDREGGMKDM